ncbi:protein-tyrosine-phosphatase MKP1-like [Curcuma longa]|uniref:protein-tyrosine-phosphatase MKP1-like n=1 Tax=Curcuma longa TaxID=136217 RepID=UPI003D9FA6EC
MPGTDQIIAGRRLARDDVRPPPPALKIILAIFLVFDEWRKERGKGKWRKRASPSSSSGTPRKSLLRSATWTARSQPHPNLNPNPNPNPNRPPKPGRLALPLPPPLAAWPRPASDDCGHCPATPSAASSTAAADDGDPDISRVDDHVYLGGDAAARDRAALRRHGITHVLNCAGAACPDHFRGELEYSTLWLRDSPAEDLAPVLYDAFDFLERARAAPRGRALVHCRRGASRSAALVVAYLMWRRALTFDDALRAVRVARPSADPNLGFAAQLLRCQRRVLALPPTPGSAAVRAYRMAPQSLCAPLYIVPKSVDLSATADASFLDSRGVFVIHTPAAIYIWLGQGCEPSMTAAAATSALQLVRYERADGPIITVHEGSEPAAFWVSLNDDPPSPNTDEFVGKRRVELYDLDYDIFRRATPRARGTLPLPVPWTDVDKKTLAKESGWGRLRREFASKGLKELTKAVLERRVLNEEDLRVSDTIRSPGSFSMESSATPSSSSPDTASVRSTFSPNSTSSSDWYNLSPPSSELHRTHQTEPNSDMQSSVTGNVKLTGSRNLVSEAPPFISEVEEDQEALDIARQLSLGASDQDDSSEDAPSGDNEDSQLFHPVLFRWPDMDKVDDAHHGVLDSGSVFLLLASESKAGSRKAMIKMYVWLGRNSRHDILGEEEENKTAQVDRIGTKFIELMGVPADTPVQVIREGEEPEQFLNHLFSFHQVNESIH